MAAVSDEALQKQFELLQQQQQQRLLRRKELKQQKPPHAQPPSDGTMQMGAENKSTSFGVEDNLDLKLEDPIPKSASYVSEELIEHLNEQLSEMTDENSRLFKLLSERDFEIRQLKKKNEEARLAFGGSSKLSSDSAASKIVELSKKNRELSAALEAKKTEARQLFGRCRHLENEVAKKSDETVSPRLNTVVPVNETSPRSHAESEAKIKQVTDRLRASEQKNAEYRNQVQSLKNEIKMAQKVVSQEIGEGVHIHELLNTHSNWRGRAQQILALQKKVGEMKVQIEQSSGLSTSRSNQTLDREMERDLNNGGVTHRADMKHRESLRKLEKDKKEQQERAAAELKALEGDYNSLKQKFDASKARNKVLSNENKSFRTEMQKLMDKGAHDDELISALISQQMNMKQMIEELSSLQRKNEESQAEQINAISARTQHENNIISQLKTIVSEKEAKVKQLETELVQLRNSKILESQKNSVNSLFERPDTGRRSEVRKSTNQTDLQLNSPSPSPPPQPPTGRESSRPGTRLSLAEVNSNGEHTTRTAHSLPLEDETTLNGPPSSRPSTSDKKSRPQSRAMSARSQSASRNAGSRPATGRKFVQSSKKITTANSALVTEMNDRLGMIELQCQEYQSLAQSAQVERDRLMELLQLTQKRLDEANDQTIHYQREMKSHKQAAVQLEKTVGKLRMESAGPYVRKQRDKTGMGSSISLNSAADAKYLHGFDNKVEDLETQLAIQKDENEAIKAALESTLQAKEEDLKVYNQMIEQTKMIFLQGLRQFKANSSAKQ